jgi:hypothetical protein
LRRRVQRTQNKIRSDAPPGGQGIAVLAVPPPRQDQPD